MSIKFQRVAVNRLDGEKNDCTVRAMSTACDAPYEEVHKVLATWGRKPRRGMYTHQFRGKTEILGRKMVELPLPALTYLGRLHRPTLAALLPKMRTGRYFVLKTSHAFAVIDGVVMDAAPNGARSRIDGVWRIEPVAASPVVAPVPTPFPAPLYPSVSPAGLPWIVQRYVQLRRAGNAAEAVKLFNNVNPKMQALMLQEVNRG